MKSLLFVATALISVITANRVIHLTADNFDAIVDGTRNVFVKFEASWCGPCKRMAPIMDKVAAESFPDLDGETILAAIDADAEIEIADRFEIGSFPTVKLFLKGRELDESIEYNGDRSSENISRFIRSQVAMNEQSLPAEIKQIKPDIPLTQLLKELAKVGPSRKTLKSGTLNFNNFASGFFGDETDNDDFYKSNAPDLQMNLKQKKIRNRKDKTRSRRNVGSVHRAEDKSGLPLVSAEQAKSIIKSAGSKPVILIFFSPNCPHCKEFLPLAAKYAETRPDAIIVRINGDQNVVFRDSFNLRYYPSIIGFFANSNGARYELMASDRGIEHFNSFIEKLSKN